MSPGYYPVDSLGRPPGGGTYDFGTSYNGNYQFFTGSRENPQKLDGSGVMLPPSITTVYDAWNVAQCEYIGSVNEDGPREEEYFDLVPPELL